MTCNVPAHQNQNANMLLTLSGGTNFTIITSKTMSTGYLQLHANLNKCPINQNKYLNSSYMLFTTEFKVKHPWWLTDELFSKMLGVERVVM